MSKIFNALILSAAVSLTVSFTPKLASGEDPYASCDIQTRSLLEARERARLARQRQSARVLEVFRHNIGERFMEEIRKSEELGKELDRLNKEYSDAQRQCRDNVRAVLRQKQETERQRREEELRRRADAEDTVGDLSSLLLQRGVKDTKDSALALLIKSAPSEWGKSGLALGLANDFRLLSQNQDLKDKYNSVIDIAHKLNVASNPLQLSRRLTSDALDRMKEIHLSAFDQLGTAIKSFEQDFSLSQSGRSSFGLGRGGGGSWDALTKRFDAELSQFNREFKLRLEKTQSLPEPNINRQFARLNSAMEEVNRQHSARTPPVARQPASPASEDERLARERAKKEAQALEHAARQAEEVAARARAATPRPEQIPSTRDRSDAEALERARRDFPRSSQCPAELPYLNLGDGRCCAFQGPSDCVAAPPGGWR